MAAAWNGSDSALIAFNPLRGNFTAKTIIRNSHVDALALNLSDGSTIFASRVGISSLAMGDSKSESKVESIDRSVAIAYDHCNGSRLFYVTKSGDSSVGDHPVIKIVDGDNKIVASISNLTSVRAVAVDPWSGLVYWIDKVGRREFRLERADRDGDQRQTVCERVTDQNPFDLSVGRDFIAWSDWYNTAVWKMDKSSGTCEPEVLLRFNLARPMGVDFTKRPHSCSDRVETTEQRSHQTPILQSSARLSGTGQEDREPRTENNTTTNSISSKCANFCLNAGNCSQDNINSSPVCTCPPGHSGLRCELDDFYFWAFVMAASVAVLAFTAVVCLGVTYFRSFRRRHLPVVISKRRPSTVRSFTGGPAPKKSTEETFGAKSCSRDGAVVDLEDCCHMTLCESVSEWCSVQNSVYRIVQLCWGIAQVSYQSAYVSCCSMGFRILSTGDSISCHTKPLSYYPIHCILQ